MTLRLLEFVFVSSCSFDAVIVVDSEGDKSIPARAMKERWPILYYNDPINLGAAGNHAKRLEIAAQHGLEWCYFLNHDGHFDRKNVENMLDTASMHSRIGAVYPLIYNGSRGKPWEDGRQSFYPSATKLSSVRPPLRPDIEVKWGSSNGALYGLAPYRAGLRIWTEVWHGYEDFGYGALLHDNGWKQFVCRRAVLRNAYQYKREHLFGGTFHLPDKPAWYAYYGIRNLILIQKRRPFSLPLAMTISMKAVRETVTIILFRRQKLLRLYLTWLGLFHGLTGIGGKGRYPDDIPAVHPNERFHEV